MKTNYVRNVLVSLLAALAVGTMGMGGGGTPFPNVTIPGVPDKGPCCLVRVQKVGGDNTVRKFDFGNPYVCKLGDKTFKMARGPATLTMTLKSGGNPCDENPKLIPNGSLLEAKGVLTRRLNDGFSHFIGTFTIHKGATILFKGTLETIDNISTHHKPFGDDPCDKKKHLQGWLVGAGVDKSVANYTLRAMLEANIKTTAAGKQEFLFPIAMDGVLVECHKAEAKKD